MRDRNRASGRWAGLRLGGTTMVIVAILALLLPSMAAAEGGKSIATAPPIAYGQQEFGNTAEGQELEGQVCRYRSYWSLSVTAGDLLTINWEATPGTELKLMPPGTTDYNLFQTEPAVSEELSANNKNQATYNVPVSGVMPLYFRTCPFSSSFEQGRPGPYNFIVTAQHGLSVSLLPREHVLTSSVIYGSAVLTTGGPVPDGTVFTLTATWEHGSASYSTASVGGGLAFTLALPEEVEGQEASLALSRPADSTYLAPTTAEIQTHVARPRVVPPPHHKPLVCRKGFKKRRVHGKARCVRVKKRQHRR